MNLNFQSYYWFGFLLGVSGIIIGSSLLQKSYWFLILIIISFFFSYNSIARWNKSQKNKDRITKLELDRKDAKLDFDIQSIDGENDDDFEPAGFDEKGRPEGINVFPVVEIKTTIQVYNPCLIDNIARSVEIYINRGTMHKKMEITNFSPVRIKPRDHALISLSSYCRDFQGEKDDKIMIVIKTMDEKEVKKETNIEYYGIGQNRSEAMSN